MPVKQRPVALHAQADRMDKRLRPVYDALDAGQYREALRVIARLEEKLKTEDLKLMVCIVLYCAI